MTNPLRYWAVTYPSYQSVSTVHPSAGAGRCNANDHRAKRAFPAERSITWQRSEPTLHADLAGRNYCVAVYDERRERLIAELARYYAPVPCQEESTYALRDPATQRKEVQRQRHARWLKRTVDPTLWVAHG